MDREGENQMVSMVSRHLAWAFSRKFHKNTSPELGDLTQYWESCYFNSHWGICHGTGVGGCGGE